MSSRMHDLTTTARAFIARRTCVGSAQGIEPSAWLPPAPAGVIATQ